MKAGQGELTFEWIGLCCWGSHRDAEESEEAKSNCELHLELVVGNVVR